MTKKNRKIRHRPDGGPLWYAAAWLFKLGLQQSDIVQRTKYAKSEVSGWVSCKERFNADVLYAFAKAMGIEARDLLTRPEQADSELVRAIRKLDSHQQDRALKVLRAADILPPADRAA